MTADRALFYVQARPKEPWHVETDTDCEAMLCGLEIPSDLPSSRVQTQWGVRKCPDCWLVLERVRRVRLLR